MKEKVGPHLLLLDFDNVRYVSSEGLGRLLKLQKKVLTAGGHIRLCNVHGVLSVFETSGLEKILDIHETACKPEASSDPFCQLKPTKAILDGPGITELENQYQVWWNASPLSS
jgi:hypothetical protein